MSNTLLRTVTLAGASILLTGQALLAAPVGYQVDPVHSSINFSVRHVFSQVPGKFKDFKGSINYDKDKPAASKVEFTVQADSISTDNDKRDGHLKSPDFFDTAKFPTLSFVGEKVIPTGGNPKRLKVVGKLTMHGVSKLITVPVEILGFGQGMGGPVAGFSAEFTVNRKDFGIVWNKNLDAGGTMLGDEVNIKLNVEAKQDK